MHTIKDSKKEYKLSPKLLMMIMQETMKEMLKNLIDMDSTDVFHELSKRESNTVSLQILSLLHYVYKKLLEKTKEKFNISDGGDNGEDDDDATVANKAGAGEEVKKDAAGEEDGEEEVQKAATFKSDRDLIIYPYLMNLLFESTFDEVNDISYEKIKFLYWDYDFRPQETTLDPDAPKKARKDGEEEEKEEDYEEDLPEPNERIFYDFNEKQYFI